MKKNENTRVYYIEFAKVAALLLLILFHFLSEMELHGLLQNPNAFKVGGISLLNLGGVNLTLGNYAFSLFFVTAGAELMYVYQSAKDRKEFYRRCILGIYPVYYIAFTAAFFLRIILDRSMDHGTPVWSYLLTVLGIDGWLGEILPTYALVGEWLVGCVLGIVLLFPLFYRSVSKKPYVTVIVCLVLFLVWEHFYPFDFSKGKDILLRAFEVLLGMCFVMLDKKVTWKGAGISVLLLGVIFAVRMPWVSTYLLTPVAGLGLFLLLTFLSRWFEGEKIKRAVLYFALSSFPAFLMHHFLINILMERVPEASLGIFGMVMMFIACLTVIWASGIGIRKLEMRIGKLSKYEGIYTTYVSKVLLAFGAFLYLGRFVYLAWTQAPSFDGSMNLQVPVSLVEQGLYATRYDGISLFAGRIQTGAPVLLPIALLFKILGIGSAQALMVNVLYVALMILFICLISRELKANRTVTLLVMGATTLLWGFLELAMGIFGEIPTLALFLGNIYFLMLAERRGKRKYFAVAGIFFGFSYLTKTVILIAVPALVLVFASKWLVEKKMKLKDLFLWLGGAVLPVAAFESYKIVQLGIDGYVAFWDNQSGNILKQAGVKEGFADTVGVFQKLWVHLEVFAETFNIQSAAIIVLLGFNFVWFVCKAVKRKKLDFVDILDLVAYSYFGWWLLITPTEKAWGRRILIGVVLLQWISSMKLWQVFERFLQRERLSEGKSIKAVAETVVSAFAIAFIAFGAISYSGDSKKGSVELAGIVRQKASEEQAVICGYGWWQAPVISFYAGIDFVDLESLEPIGQGRPVYFVADQAWLVDSGQTEADLPYPVELVYEESHTGQRLYRIK